MPLRKASGPLSARWRETSGSVGSLRPGKKRPGNAALRLASIRCVEECAGRAVGPAARTAEACCDASSADTYGHFAQQRAPADAFALRAQASSFASLNR